MITTQLADLRGRHRIRQSAIARSPFETVMQVRDRRLRRTTASVMIFDGGERLDLSQIERRSFFDHAAPERC
ncbi:MULTISPECIES: hypothetical protein [unclassified Aureimonas]|uniref:hypothetical protein n=1 Tax=unclassified Aureimonas TaxID=2615206 RepID=UPI0006FCF434|nr:MULTISPECIES: hypothetical protein [unclassified Aureimonas]KQT52857.1 hypothetical protein ASG62_13120 [Aureimonas sp. Leaf427]KQT80316.1 hypothetical protein ASG54_06970 [Aureimonas sp. Leaf460]